MKKIIYSAVAMALAFFAGSCQQENLEPVGGNTVTYTVQVPGALATKSAEDFVLTYQVYREGQVGVPSAAPIYKGTEAFENDKAELSLEFVKDQKFVVLFWAQKDGAPYNIDDLRKVSLTALTSNDVNADAFAGTDNVINCESDKGGVVELVRPIAQLNIATLTDGLTIGNSTSNTIVTPNKFNMNVSGLWSSYNVATGNVNESAGNISFAESGVPGGEFKTDYTLMGKNYIGFIPKDGTNVTVDFNIVTENDGTINHVVSNVPLKPNYRTNILGNLVSASDNYTVTLDEEWGDAGKDMEVLADGLVKNINGDYEITSEVGLAYAINNLFVDANGVANSAAFYIKPAVYDMSKQSINDITVKSGTLKVYDTEAVVTRSATFGSVVITGLNKPLITTVEEDATVFFSGITIQNYEGADGSAALVGNNEGKVVLNDCGIVDENGAPDQETMLVGGNPPVVIDGVEEPAGELVYTEAQLAAAVADETVESIVLGADIALENTLVFPKGRTATLDLCGQTLTIADPEKVATTYALNNHGTLTIKDSYQVGSVNARGIYNGYGNGDENIPAAKLIIDGGTFNAMGTNGGAAIYNYGIVEINCGTFNSNGGYALNNQAGASMSLKEANVRGGIYNCGTVAITASQVYQHISGRHAIYNWAGSVTINSGKYDSESGNELILADGENASVTINDGEFHKTAKSWLYAAATGKDISFVINGGTHYGYVNEPEMTVDTFRPYGDKFVVTGGSFNFDVNQWCDTDFKAVKNNQTSMWDVVGKDYVAQIGDAKYETLQEAVAAAEAGSIIKFLTDIEQVDGVLITDKNLTIDLNDKTFTVSKGANTNNRNFKINGSSVVTIKNGTMVANGTISTGAYGTVRTEDSANVTLNDVKLYSYRGYGLNVKACAGTTITISDSEIYTQYSGGVEAAGGIIILDNVKIDQRGVDSAGAWCSVAIGVNGGGKVTVNSGEYSAAPISTDANAAQGTWVAYVMSSGGTLEIKGGTFNGTIAETAAAANACGIICADAKAVVDIYGGTFNSNGAILDMRNNSGATPNPVATLYGGVFSADPRVSGLYSSNLIKIAEGFQVVKNGNIWNVVAVPKNNEIWYTSDEMALEPTNPEAINATVVSNEWDRTTGKGIITFDAPLNVIGEKAFQRVTNTTPSNWATTITLPEGLETIGEYAFAQCYSLTNITIPNSVTSIGQYAFKSCDAVTTVTIGSGVTTIGSGAFYNCYEIKEIVCKATEAPILADKWVFNGVSKDIKVVVPADALNTYKEAEHWKSFTNIVAE